MQLHQAVNRPVGVIAQAGGALEVAGNRVEIALVPHLTAVEGRHQLILGPIPLQQLGDTGHRFAQDLAGGSGVENHSHHRHPIRFAMIDRCEETLFEIHAPTHPRRISVPVTASGA